MQKSDLIRSKKWAMEDVFLREVGVKSIRSTSMRSWNESWEISTKNRDRPGGHMPSRYYHTWKKADKRKARREHVRITAEAVREFYEDHELYLQEIPIHTQHYPDEFDLTMNYWYDPKPINTDMAIHIYKAYTGKDI